MATPTEWSRGYARQARADLIQFERSQAAEHVEVCHKLQLLQMACEKLVKAHLCGEGTDPKRLQTSHAYVAGTLPVVLRQHAIAIGFRGKNARWVLQHAKHLAQEIEVLAPSVKRGGDRPDNCEYPWEDDVGRLHVPLDWSFYPARLIEIPAGRAFLKLVRGAIEALL
jgi:hypothetical protein